MMEVCGICGAIFEGGKRYGERRICNDCLDAYATNENIKEFLSHMEKETFELSQYYGYVFGDQISIEKALDIFIEEHCTEGYLKERAIECAKNDEVWFKGEVFDKYKEEF